MSTPLSEVFDGEAPAETVNETETIKTETVEATAEPTGDTQETETAPPAEETKVDYEAQRKELENQINAFKAKAQDEKQKRQALERQIQSNTPPPEKISVFDDEDAAINQRVQPALNQVDMRFNSLSEDMARRLHPDYDDKFSIFEQMAQKDPTLVVQLQRSANPAMFAYDKAVEFENMQSMQSIDNLSEVTELAKELNKAGGLEAWRKQQIELLQKQVAEEALNSTVQNIPPSLAKATAAGGTAGAGFAGATPLNQIIGEKAR